MSGSFLGAIDSMSSVLLNKTEGNQTVSLDSPTVKVAMKKASNNTDDGLFNLVLVLQNFIISKQNQQANKLNLEYNPTKTSKYFNIEI